MSLGLNTVILLEKWMDGSAKQYRERHRALIRQVINVLKLLEPHRWISNRMQSEQDNKLPFLC